ncbi:MAG TPA: hypothetical protein DCE78_02955 [Bacteroidetes bacterium]|nr:hypothetical protein [Bacteroidota bacterium]
MNLIIKLPPKAERDDIVKAWVSGVKQGDNFAEFRSLLQGMVDTGYNHNGIACLFLHESTTKLIRHQLSKEVNSEHLEIALALPIGFN